MWPVRLKTWSGRHEGKHQGIVSNRGGHFGYRIWTYIGMGLADDRAVEPGAAGELCQIAGSGEFDLGKQGIRLVVAQLSGRSPHRPSGGNGFDHVLDVAGGNHRGSGRGWEACGIRRPTCLRAFYGCFPQEVDRG